jgi:hypothetical protein
MSGDYRAGQLANLALQYGPACPQCGSVEADAPDHFRRQCRRCGAQYPTPEHWRPVVGYESKYSVSDLGRVRSEPKSWTVRGKRHRRRPCILLQTTGGRRGNYRRVHLHDLARETGKHRCLYVHALVLAAFVGPRPDGAEILHGEGGPADNRLVNLAYGSREENLDDESVKLWIRNNPHAEPAPF